MLDYKLIVTVTQCGNLTLSKIIGKGGGGGGGTPIAAAFILQNCVDTNKFRTTIYQEFLLYFERKVMIYRK